MGRRVLLVLAAMVGLALVLAAVISLARGDGDRGVTNAPPVPPPSTPIPCLGQPARACAERATRVSAEREHLIAVRSVTCTRATDSEARFDCDADLAKACDSYRVRWVGGNVFVEHPEFGLCVHVRARPL